jgi:hypothetical protein
MAVFLVVLMVAIAGLAHTAPAPFLLEAFRPRPSAAR